MKPTFAARLRTLRAAAGLTQRQLAERADMQRTHLYALEAGRKAKPRWETVSRLAKALGVSPGEFLGA